MSKATILLCVLAACHGDRPQLAAAPLPVVARVQPTTKVLDPQLPLRVEALGTPVRSSRTWTTALVPNAHGGWNFITQSWELGSHELPEYVVVDLERGTSSVMDAPQKGYAVGTYQVRNQLRGSNGRVFFPVSGAGLAYYDPADEKVKAVPSILPPGGPDKIIYSATFGPDGMLYGGTQSNGLPAILQIDPDTLHSRVLGHVGRDRKTYSYAYEIAVDPPWIYATVGELPWELAALNMKTGESRILATRADRGWMHLQLRPQGVRAKLITGVHTSKVASDYVWCVDGKAIPDAEGRKLPVRTRLFERPKPLVGAPELDVSQSNPDAKGVGRIRWRPAGTGDWKAVKYTVKHTARIAIEALTPLPDGSVLGSTKQYHGFFTFRGSSSMFLGGPSPSNAKLALLDGTLYMTGYPNSVLYSYDPRRPWTGTSPQEASASDANPRMLGNFTATGTKYAYFLTPSQNRLYFAGRAERDGFGIGIGYYEPATRKFAGVHTPLLGVVPSGLVVLPELQRVVLSERVRADNGNVNVPQAELVIYDKELAESDRLVVKPGLADTGLIYLSPVKNVIIGVLHDAVYRYDIARRKLLDWRELPGVLETVAQRPVDKSIWVVIGTSLARIDPTTLEIVTFGHPGSVPIGLEHLVWQGEDLYASVDADLYRIARVGLP